jgi:hypothetical protein
MKKLLLPMAALLVSTGLQAQTYFYEGFDSGDLTQWTNTDVDGDGASWGVADYETAPATNNVATSASWSQSPLTPDNWLKSSAIDLTSATGVVNLNWKVFAQDQDWVAENYSVYVSSTLAGLATATASFTEVLTTSAGYMDRQINVSAFNGGMLYFAFRHHDCTDQFRMNLDDISVQGDAAFDIQLIDVDYTQYTLAGNQSITGTVRNGGLSAITSYTVDWNDGTAHSETFNSTIQPGETQDFTHGTALTVVGGTDYVITACADVTNDALASNNCLAPFTIYGLTSSPTRTVVGEEKTGTWCGWCPRGAVALTGMESESNFIGIAVHNGDPMTVSSYDSNIGTYVPGGYPGGGVDRVISGNPASFSTMFAQRATVVTPVTIGVNATVDMATGVVTVNASADFFATVNGDYRIAVVLTEDHVTGTDAGYNQANYYDDGAAGAMESTIINFVGAGDPVPAADMEYDHVARALGDDLILGTVGSVPAANAAGTNVTKTYTFTLDPSWNAINMHAVAMFVDGTTGEIMNAGKSNFTGAVSVSEIENNFSVSIYPNPASDVANVRVELTETSNVSIEVYNTLGKLVYSENTNDVSQGAYYYSVNTLDFATGLYSVKTTVNGNVSTTKLAVK